MIYSAIFIRAASPVVGQSPYVSSVGEVNLKHKFDLMLSNRICPYAAGLLEVYAGDLGLTHSHQR